ncbi:hypothetical protein C1645_813986 [Glomus cerebriforme]|uniref:Protein kinase domain-containing protein n=1 Tax=Glomus cerebriforme TaxID=658196 RepID=A0A397TRR5_9GLOM|nr:hypothetical protein C1645_813986 [Glomus cerebriforme]
MSNIKSIFGSIHTPKICKPIHQRLEITVKTNITWYKSCNIIHFQEDFDKCTSGNKDIDKLIQDIQLSGLSNKFEWIPYDRFNDIKYIAEGGFAKVYSAIWIDGWIKKWKKESNNWERNGPEKYSIIHQII